MAGEQPNAKPARGPKLSFSKRLVLGLTTLSILSLIVMFVIVNTVVRGIIYDNVTGIAQRDTKLQASGIDAWFKNSNQFVEYLTITWQTTGIKPGIGHGIDPIAARFVEESDIFDEVFVGFENGRFVGGRGWIPDPDWDPRPRPWFTAAMTAPDKIVTVLPFAHVATGDMVSAVAKWVPDLDGMEAVVAVGIPLDYILEVLRQYEVLGGGYLILVGPDGEIIFHPDPLYKPAQDGLRNLREIPNGKLLMDIIASSRGAGNGVGRIDDPAVGPAYAMVFPLVEGTGWTLTAIVPTEAISRPVRQNLAPIMAALAVFLAALFIFTMFFVSRLTRSMEESRTTEERLRLIFENMPMASYLRDRNFNILNCNLEVTKLFGLRDTQEYIDRFMDLSPEFQPDGTPSVDKAEEHIAAAFETGKQRFEWMHRALNGEPIPCEVSLVRVDFQGGDHLVAFVRDLREFYENQKNARRMERRLKLMLDSAPLACCITDYESNVLDCNIAAVELFELKDRQEFCEKFFELSPKRQPDGTLSQTKLQEILKQTFETKRVHFEWMHQTLDGKQIPCEVILERMVLDDKPVKVGYLRDMRDFHKYIEAKQREHELSEREQVMFNATPLIIEYWDKDFNCIACNKTAFDFYGYSSLEERTEKLLDVLPEFQPNGKPSWEEWKRHVEQIFEEGYTRFDFAEYRTNGDNVFLDVLGVRTKYNNNLVAVTYSNDITELRETQIRMREADERTHLMLDGTPVACYLISKDFKAIDCNKETLHLFDFRDKGEGIFMFYEVFSGQRLDDFQNLFESALETGANRFEWILQKPGSREPIPCDIALIRLSHRGEYVIAAYIFDLRVLKEMLRERQRVEIAEESSRAKSRFLARMSHEIRTPLTAVLGISEIQLQDSALTPHTEEAFAKIHNSASTLLSLVNDILDLSKIEAGKMSLVSKNYEVASLISDVVQLHMIYMSSKKIDFKIHVDEQLPMLLVGDELRIKQILNNLLSNAFKYTEVGSVELALRREENPLENHVTLVISLRDTGLGMTKKQVKALSSEYVRFHERERQFIDGTGLGMPIVFSLVQMMDGKIDVESMVAKGTSIAVRIPQKIASQTVLGKETARSLQQFELRASIAKKFKFVPEPMPYGSVLVVDDVEANLYVAKGLLQFYDLKIETCGSGYAAIERISQGKVYDIIFMDQMMPIMDGIETAKNLRSMGYAQPIVALTANALIGQAERFLRIGFDGFISKPIQTTHLNTILTKYIRDKQPPEVIEAARAASSFSPSPPDGAGGINGYMNRPEVTGKLRADFAREQENAAAEISGALDAGDAETARRLAHTLKGLAAMIKEGSLSAAAGDLEKTLKNGETGEEARLQLAILEKELAPVLESAQAAQVAQAELPGRPLDKSKAKVLLDRLAESLASDSAENLSLAEELKGIPEAAVLARQIEELEFDTALKTLATLRKILEV